MPLTKVEQKIYKFIIQFTSRMGYAPTYNEIGGHLGHGKQYAYGYVRRMRKKGVIRPSRGKWRGIKIK